MLYPPTGSDGREQIGGVKATHIYHFAAVSGLPAPNTNFADFLDRSHALTAFFPEIFVELLYAQLCNAPVAMKRIAPRGVLCGIVTFGSIFLWRCGH